MSGSAFGKGAGTNPDATGDRGNGEPVLEVWAWVKVFAPGDEGVAAAMLPGAGPMPLLGARESTMRRMAPLVAQAADATGVPHELRRYRLADVADVVNPRNAS